MKFFSNNKKDLSPDYDSITKLSSIENTHKFFKKLSNGGKGYAYVYLNINNFNHINNVFGYDTGNNVLKDIADDIQRNINNDEIITRLIADEFALLLRFDNKQNFTDRIKKIIDSLENIEVTNGEIIFEYHCSVTCSIYEIQGNESAFDEIADLAKATYSKIKQQDGSTYAFFDISMQENMKQITELLPMVQEAFEQRQITPYFQPKYQLKTNNIISAQIVAQWNHPRFGLIEPTDFSFILGDSGNVLKLEFYIFEESCRLLQKWLNDECMPVPLSVNISNFNLYELNFVDKVMRIVNQYEVPTCLLELQINPEVLCENPVKILEVMEELHSLGFILSLDNFGKDYVPLDILCGFPIHVLNLNQEFIEKAKKSDNMKNVLRSVVGLAHQLKMTISSNGVGDAETEAFLQQIRCDYVQSNLYSDLKSIEEFEKLIF